MTAEAGGTCGDSTTVLALANATSTASATAGGMMVFVSNTGKGNCTATLTGLKATCDQKAVSLVKYVLATI